MRHGERVELAARGSWLLQFAFVGVALALMALGACRSASPSETGIRLGEETLKQFQPGETTEDWLISVIGPPTSRTDRADGISVLRYSTESKSTGVLSWFGGSGTRNTATIYFISRDGVISQFWADRQSERTLLGKQVEQEAGEKKGGDAD